MKTILQLSDFHIKLSMGKPERNPVFRDFVAYVKGMKLSNIILVYNGDVIDSRCISDRIPDSLTDDQKAEIWEVEAKKAFDLAKEYFDYLMHELRIPNNKIIICCGNHDINRYDTGINPVDCDFRKITYGDKRFNLIDKFIYDIALTSHTHETHFKKIDGINFLVANSQWADKSGAKLCINCESIKKQIQDNFPTLDTTLKTLNKQHNILVAHAPRTDYCENALFPYLENDFDAIGDRIDALFGLQLYGDKHTDSSHNYDYIVGAPLDSKRIAYGLHQFSDAGQYSHRTLLYHNHVWQTVGSLNDIETILAISEPALKRHALKFLFGTKSEEGLGEKVKNFEEIRSGKKWKNLDVLFHSFATIQKPKPGMAGEAINPKDGIINTLSELIAKSIKKVSLILRGEARLGKSLFMSVLYLNLLYRFGCGTFDFIPLYVNIEKIMEEISGSENRDSASWTKKVKGKITKILDQGSELAKKYNSRVCCLIDGLNQHVFYQKAKIEQMIEEVISGGNYPQYAHYIYCIDTDMDLNLEFTPQHTARDAEYLVYFNRIRTQKVNSTKKYDNFVEAFCGLNDYKGKSADQIRENIRRMQILEIDLNMLIVFGDYLRIGNRQSFFDILDEFAKSKLMNTDMETAARISFYLYMDHRNYTWIREKMGTVKVNNVFEVIRTQKLIAKYLLAANYVIEATKIGDKPTENSRGMNYLYGHEVCSYIRGYIAKMNLQMPMLAFAKANYGSLSFSGKSTISFLIGRMNADHSDVLMTLDGEREILEQSAPDKMLGPDYYQYGIARRSILLSRIENSDRQDEMVNEYITLLLSDKWERKINRDFYLQYYEDCGEKEMHICEDVVYEGFDIYNTYHLLASRIKAWGDSDKYYPLLRLELFTLCDIIQIRLDTPCALRKDSRETVASFFYNSKYNKPADTMAVGILASLLEAIDLYLEHFPSQKDMFTQYLLHQRESFMAFKEKIDRDVADDSRTPFDPRALLSNLLSLEKAKKTGWNIHDRIDVLGIDAYETIRNSEELYETTLEHVYEAYLIGLLYLPNKSFLHSDYNKQKILNMLLIHDIGEAYIGDYPPAYLDYEAKKKEESRRCKEIFLSGIHPGISDLTDYLKLWLDWQDPTTDDYNIKIAKEIDIIQMLYKLLTLIQRNQASYTEARFKDFWESVASIHSDEGKAIFKILITENQAFTQITKKYRVNNSIIGL